MHTFKRYLHAGLIPLVILPIFLLTQTISVADVVTAGGLKREVFLNIPGETLAGLTNNARFPGQPDVVDMIGDFESPSQYADNYGARFSGYLLPPVSGEYVFYIAADDQGALFLSTDGDSTHKVQIAIEPTWAFPRSWIDCPTRTGHANISAPIWLKGGHAYYIEALLKEAGGGDCLGVAWRKPGDPEPANGDPPIPAQFLRVSAPANLAPEVNLALANGTRYDANRDIVVTAAAQDPDGEIAQVEFFAGGKTIGISTKADPSPVIGFPEIVAVPLLPMYSITWTNVPVGNYELTAVATDNVGLSTTSAPVEVVVAERPVVTIVATDPSAAEYGVRSAFDTGTFTVSRTGPTNDSLTVSYEIGGTAMNGVDYLNLPGVVTIAAGQSSADIIVAPISDAVAEGTETVELTLVEPIIVVPMIYPPIMGWVPYDIGKPDTAVVEIADAPLPVPVVVLVAPTNGAVVQTPSELRLSAAVSGSGSSRQAVQFFAEHTSLGIVLTPDPIVLPVDGTVGSDLIGPVLPGLHYSLIWTNPPPGEHVLTAVGVFNGRGATSAPVNISVVRQSTVPEVSITAVDSYALEKSVNGSPKAAVFKVRRTGSTQYDLMVWYSIGGTALNGVDYKQIPNMVTIPAGKRAGQITIQPVDDTLVEGDETVILKLEYSPLESFAQMYEIGLPSIAAAVIADDDSPRAPGPPTFVDGALRLRFAGENAATYQLEMSTNLVDWTPVAQAVASDGGVSYVDAQTSQSPCRFYRMRPAAVPAAVDE